MTIHDANVQNDERRRLDLSIWDNESGAGLHGNEDVSPSDPTQLTLLPAVTNAELAQLRVRVIALENVVISLLTQSSDRQLDRVRDVAAYIAPRPGVTPHPLTIRAAAEMVHLVERARHYRGLDDNLSALDPR
jgi:hypothetical protein